jgi:hypothetical protein
MAALKDPAYGFANRSVMFIGAKGHLIGEMALEGQVLRPTTPEMRHYMRITARAAAIDIRHVRQFVIMGAGFRVPMLEKRLSSAVRGHCLQGAWKQSVAARLVDMLTPVAKQPVIVLAQPLFSQIAPLAKLDHRYVPFKELHGPLTGIIAQSGAVHLAQPLETIAGQMHTDAQFSAAPPRFTRGDQLGVHPDGDCKHMNAQYGALVLKALFDHLDQQKKG